jgi:hypothetical protein
MTRSWSPPLKRCSPADPSTDYAEPSQKPPAVLPDVPIDGCGNLSSTRPRRCVDDGLAKSGIPVLPSVKAGKRGPELRTLLLKERADLLIEESHPYAVLRVLWALRQTSRRFRFKDDGVSLDLSTWWWRARCGHERDGAILTIAAAPSPGRRPTAPRWPGAVRLLDGPQTPFPDNALKQLARDGP